MTNNKFCTITIAEPWNFESPDGINVVKGEILAIMTSKILVFKADYLLDFSNLVGDVLILTPRHKNASFSVGEEMDVSGGLLLIDYKPELNEEELKSNCRFVLIGTIITG